jgi:hypothetical protein
MSKIERLQELAISYPNEQGTIKFPIEAGALVRYEVRKYLEHQKRYNSFINLSYEEVPGFLESTFHVVVKATAQNLYLWYSSYIEMIDDYNKRFNG